MTKIMEKKLGVQIVKFDNIPYYSNYVNQFIEILKSGRGISIPAELEHRVYCAFRYRNISAIFDRVKTRTFIHSVKISFK